MRFPLRSLASLALAAGVATCADAPSVAPKPANGTTKGRISIVPVFSKEAAATFAQRSQFAEITFDQVHVVVTRPPDEVVFETRVPFTPNSPPVTIDPTIEVRAVGEVFNVTVDYTSNGVVVFHGTTTVVSHAVDQPAPPPQTITVQYVGPGATAVRVTVAPKTVSIEGVGTRTFTATATDANNNAIGTPVTWSSSDLTVATIDANTGVLTTTGKRGTTTVTAKTPTNLSDNATVTVTLPAANMALVSGGGQTGRVGTTLAQPAVVRVTASDGQPVAGVTVIFAAPIGGNVGSSSVTTDATGQASTTLTLGNTVGPQSFSASSGSLSVSISATATAGTAALIQAVSGGGQADTVRQTLRAPLVVRVTDQFGNPVSGVTVTWTTSGSGSLSATTSVTNAAGDASVTYTLGGVAGSETITATATGVGGSAVFNVTATAAGPADIVLISGNNQSGRALQPLANPFVVTVIDRSGATVPGVLVTWTPTNGTFPSNTTTTDAQGQTRNTMTLGPNPGQASATASVAGKSVTFNATVQAGVPSTIAFRVGPSTVAAGDVMKPPVQVEFRDAAGNLTPVTNTVTVSLANNPGEATLSGTLTRAAVNGVATFDDLRISNQANGYQLAASSSGVPTINSAPFNVTAASPRTLTLVDAAGQPIPPPPPTVTMVAGKAPTNPPAIRITDASGAVAPNVTLGITVTRSGTVVFTGNATSNAQGLVTFAAMLVSPSNFTTAGNYTVTATLTGANGSPINIPVTIVPDAPAALRFNTTSFPTTATAGGTLTPAIQVSVTDQYGNVETNNTDNITIGITPGTGTQGAVLSGTKTRAAVNGVATFNDLSIDRSGTYTLSASTPTVASGASFTSPAITVGAGAPVKFLVTANPSVVNAGSTSALTAQLVDANNNPVPTAAPRTVSWTFVNTGTGSISPNPSQTNAQGTATTTLSVPSGASPITFNIQATDVNNTAINGQVQIAVTSGANTITTPTPASAVVQDASQPFPAASYPLATVRNGSGQPAAGVQVTFSFVSGFCAGRPTVLVNTDANGNAQLSAANFAIDRTTAHSCLLTATIPTGGVALSVVVVPNTGVRAWIGGTSRSWSTNANWFQSARPASDESAWIPMGVLNSPTLTANTTIAGLQFEDNAVATLDLASFGLTVVGDILGGTGNVIGTGTPGVTLAGSGARTVAGVFFSVPLFIGAAGAPCGTYTLPANGILSAIGLTVNCPFVLANGTGTAAGAALNVVGNLLVQGASARLQMNGGGNVQSVTTSGDVVFDGASEEGFLTQGAIFVGGNFVQAATFSPASFAADNVFDVLFSGGSHTVSLATIGGFQSGQSHFGRLEVFGAQVRVNTPLITLGAVQNGGQLTFAGAATVAGMVFQTGSTTTVDGANTGVHVQFTATFIGATTVGRLNGAPPIAADACSGPPPTPASGSPQPVLTCGT